MKKEARFLKCTLLNGTAWSAEKKYMRRYKEKCDILFGVEHRLRKCRRSSTQRPRKCGARITDVKAGGEDRVNTSGGVFIAVDCNLGTVVGDEEGTVASIPGNEGGMRVFSVYVWHSEGWTPRTEAVLKWVRVTKHSWLIACDADVSPAEFEKRFWFQRNRMHVVAPKEASACRSKGAKGDWIEKVDDYVTASETLSRPHKAVPVVVEREKETQEWNEQKLPKVLPGYNGGRLPGRSTKEKGREEGEVDEDSGGRRIRNEIAPAVVTGVKERTSAHEDAKTTARRTAGPSPVRSWDCSQNDNEEKEEEELWQKENQMEVQWVEDENSKEFRIKEGRNEVPCSAKGA